MNNKHKAKKQNKTKNSSAVCLYAVSKGILSLQEQCITGEKEEAKNKTKQREVISNSV